MKLKFRDAKLSKSNMQRLAMINSIIGEYQKLNMRLTLRQLYYQLVSRDVIPNQKAEYAKLSNLLKEGRMAGIVDWAAIEDRLRTAEKPSAWDTPADLITSAINQYEKPRMNGQDNYLEVWVEKDALSGVLSPVTEQYHVPILVNRGYSSVSAIFDAYKRFRRALEAGQKVVILYLGDFDPSGRDMIRDVYDRPLEMLLAQAWDFMSDLYDETEMFDDLYYKYSDNNSTYESTEDESFFDPLKAMVLDRFEVVSLALTKQQIDAYNPPPNPAKMQDPRAEDYVREHGTSSWEIDALRPEVLNELLTVAIETRIDLDKYEAILEEEKADIKKLEKVKKNLK